MKFLTEPIGIKDKNYGHFDLNYASGLVDAKTNNKITYAVKAFDLTDNALYNNSELNEKIKSTSFRHF